MLVQKLLFYACETTLYQAFFVDLTKEMGELWQAASNRLSKDIIIKKRLFAKLSSSVDTKLRCLFCLNGHC